MMIQSDFQIFQRDWNHQLDQIGINEVHAVWVGLVWPI